MRKIFIFSLLVVFASSLLSFSGNDDVFEIGKKISNFSLKDLAGKKFDFDKVISNPEVKGIAVVFIAHKCPASIASDARYIKTAAELKDKGILMIGINSNMRSEKFEDMAAYAEKLGYNFRVLWDEGSAVADMFQGKTTPHAFFIDKKSVLRYSGRFDDNANDETQVKERTLVKVIDEYLAGKKLSVTQTRPFG